MEFIVLGTSQFALTCAQALLDNKNKIKALVSMPRDVLPLNSADVSGFASDNGIPYHEFEDINSSLVIEILRGYEPDYIFCAWPKILNQEVLDIPKKFCIGTHPTALPYNRGRHPLHWLIDLGISETSLSFFKMDAGIDTGRILAQIPFSINPEDNISDLGKKMNTAASKGIRMICEKMREDPDYDGTGQTHEKSNYWRLRTPYDVTLDLRMPAHQILRIVRSFAQPFPCANLVFENHIIKVLSASVIHMDIPRDELQRLEPGKIIKIENTRILVKVSDEIVELECKVRIPSNLLNKKYIHPPLKYFVENPNLLQINLIEGANFK